MRPRPQYTVFELPDGRMAIPFATVLDWPAELREWIKRDNYWRPADDSNIQAYVSPPPD